MLLNRQLLIISAAMAMASSLVTVAPASADPVGSVQPFACGESTASVIDNTPRFRLVNNGGADCGFVIFDLPEKNLLRDTEYLRNYGNPRDPNALEIRVYGNNLDAVKDVVVRMCFKPQLGRTDLISIDRPLKDFRADSFGSFFELRARRNYLFGERTAGVPDLRKLSIVLTRPGAVDIGRVRWGTDLRQDFDETGKIVTTNAGCDAGKPCANRIAALKSTLQQRLKEARPTPPQRPTR